MPSRFLLKYLKLVPSDNSKIRVLAIWEEFKCWLLN